MITSKRLLEQLHKERLECATVMASARRVCAMQVQLNNNALETTKAETRYWKKRALAAEEELQQRIINQPKPRHCIDCAPEFIDCWNDGTKCIKRPAPPDSGQAGSGEGGARLAKMLVDDATFAGVLAECDNRKLLWLAMQTKAWMDTEILGKDAAILAEVESRLYPEYDGDKVKMTEWGWDTLDGEIQYTSITPSAPQDSGQALSPEEIEEIEAHSKAVFHVGAALLRIEGDEGDPSRLVYSNNPMPEPYGSAWQAYEEQAETIVELLGAPTAEKLAAPHLVTDSGQAANNFPQSPSRHSVRNSIAPDGSSPSSTGGREGCARGFDSLPVDSIQPTEPDPAPAQTAREWVQDRLFRIADSLTSGFRKVLCGNYALELADRADRAEAEAKRLGELVAEKEAVITAWMEKLSGQMSARIRAEAERDRLREERDAAIAFIKKLNATTNQHGRQYRSRCGQFLAALTAGSPEPPAR